jgi:hypothetical protein
VYTKIIFGSWEGNELNIRANNNITREEMIAIAVRALHGVEPI